MPPEMEVVIPSYSRPEPLRRTLDALSGQTWRDFSVAVVDDCSPAPVAKWLTQLEFPFPLRILATERNSGPAAARNLAVRSSTANLILFIDDDVVPDEGLTHHHVATLAAHGPRTVSIGPLRAPADWKPTPWNRWEADTLAVEYARMARGEYQPTWRQFFTGNAAIRREDFLSVGGFDEVFARAEDIEFAYRLARRGARFVFEPKAIGWHYAHRSLASWRKIPGQYAAFDLSIDQLHPELNWDRTVSSETARRNALIRLLDRGASAVGAETAVSSACIAAARVAHRGSLLSLSSRLLSAAYHLEYSRGRRQLLKDRASTVPLRPADTF